MKDLNFSLNLKLFTLEAIYATCYIFIDRAYIYLDKKDNNIVVSIKPKEQKQFNSKIWEGEFRNELLNNSLRMQIAHNNIKIREFIVGQAIYSSLPLKEKKGSAKKNNYLNDPLGIAKPVKRNKTAKHNR